MSSDPFDADGQAFPLLGGRAPIVLRPDGIDHPASVRGRRRVFTPYTDITHFMTSTHAAWIGARDSVYILSRGMFAQTGGPENLVEALARRIAALPDGPARIARMAAIEREALAAGRPRATWGLLAACLLVFALQLWIGPDVEAVANFSPPFFRDGDFWRILTANLVHAAPGFPLHLTLNMLALLVVGTLVERPLGAPRTLVVMGVSAVTSMGMSGLFAGLPVVGASGVVFGLVGAALWLEFTWADRLPAWWRYPRRSLVFLVVLNGVLGFLVPVISGTAHLGGFLGGLAASLLVARRPAGVSLRTPPPAWVVVASASVVLATAVAVGSAGFELARPGEYRARLATRLAEMPGISAPELNDLAWSIAVSEDPSRDMLEAALVLAERAVEETGRSDPYILDTLAEVHFALGHEAAAIAAIDEAIAQDPDESYFREQRRRFLGERDRDDRPDAPPLPWPGPESPEDASPDELGITV